MTYIPKVNKIGYIVLQKEDYCSESLGFLQCLYQELLPINFCQIEQDGSVKILAYSSLFNELSDGHKVPYYKITFWDGIKAKRTHLSDDIFRSSWGYNFVEEEEEVRFEFFVKKPDRSKVEDAYCINDNPNSPFWLKMKKEWEK